MTLAPARMPWSTSQQRARSATYVPGATLAPSRLYCGAQNCCLLGSGHIPKSRIAVKRVATSPRKLQYAFRSASLLGAALLARARLETRIRRSGAALRMPERVAI
jgi:hypothetical protein